MSLQYKIMLKLKISYGGKELNWKVIVMGYIRKLSINK